ncbi:MAG: Smr/MutS family protein, partial [Oscillospiraceae bacterium]|nr:Smr/MutS family protein [Oscillospiraceae bacterium]
LIRERLDKLIRGEDTKKYLQESIVTQRDGRFVIPVKVEHKNAVPGLVHDTSGSGATLFVEPMGVVEANNQIRVLKSQEKDEIDRIVAMLSAACAVVSENITAGFTACIKLELCFVKANFGAKMRGTIPELAAEPVLELRKARHPLIAPDKIVPVDIAVGQLSADKQPATDAQPATVNCQLSTVVITGPNTGGKTVALKTAGLLVLMTRCGLMIPAADGSRVGIFGEVFADIGDEQSIEQSLSTFSSHMNNIVQILAAAKAGDLVLLDELGSGTDPAEGGALAVALLEYLKERGCLIIATTHYKEVKIYALETPGVQNASCEFDLETLSPTYRLITGAPGKSNALAIARRLGLQDDVVARAERLVSSEDRRFDTVIAALEDSRREVDALKESVAFSEREAKELTAKLERENEAFAAKREKEMAIARQQALSIVESVRASGNALLDELDEAKRNNDSANAKALRSRMNAALNKLHDSANPVDAQMTVDNGQSTGGKALKRYDTVIVIETGKEGTVITAPDSRGNCTVQVGIVKMKTNVSSLRLASKKDGATASKVTLNGEKVRVSSSGKSSASHSGAGSYRGTELDIRGKTIDEGVQAVNLFIDSCVMNHIHSATIIHGKGTGALRRAVHDELHRDKRIGEYRLGKFGEGEDGVTIVSL